MQPTLRNFKLASNSQCITSSEGSFKSLTLDDIKLQARAAKSKYDLKTSMKSSFYDLVKHKIATSRLFPKTESTAQFSSEPSKMQNYIDSYVLPVSTEAKNKMISMFSTTKKLETHKDASKNKSQTSRVHYKTTSSSNPELGRSRARDPDNSRQRNKESHHLTEQSSPNILESFKDRIVIIDHKAQQQKQLRNVKKAENLVSQMKGEVVDLRGRKKRAAVAFDQSMICQELVTTLESLLKCGCDEATIYNLLEAEFGNSSIFSIILFESNKKLRRLSPRALHRLIYIRAEKSPGNKRAEIHHMRKAILGSIGLDLKKKTKGRLRLLAFKIMQTKLKEISLFEEKEKKLSDESELSRLPILVSFLKEKLLLFKLRRACNLMKDGVRTFSKVAALKMLGENKKLVGYMESDGSFKPAMKKLETHKAQDKVVLVSENIKKLNNRYFEESYKLKKKELDQDQELNDLWRNSNMIINDLVERSWQTADDYKAYRPIVKPELYQYTLD